MPGFNGLRVLSFESRRAREIAHLISMNEGVPLLAPSTREVPDGPSDAEQEFIRGILAGQFDALIFMTGVGARALIAAAESVCSRQEFLASLAKTKIVVRGPKPSAVMRELNVPVALTVPEPNTWREIVQALDSNPKSVTLRGCRIAVQEHGEPSPDLYSALRERGAEVFPVHVYRWALPEDIGPLQTAIRALVDAQVDVVMFTSSVQFVHAARVAEDLGLKSQFLSALRNTFVASIGPTTSETLGNHNLNVDFEPSHPRMGFLVKEAAEKSGELVRKRNSAIQK